jgi:hypothetical protein
MSIVYIGLFVYIQHGNVIDLFVVKIKLREIVIICIVNSSIYYYSYTICLFKKKINLSPFVVFQCLPRMGKFQMLILIQ